MGISLQPILCERDWLFLLLVVSFFIDVNFINKKIGAFFRYAPIFLLL